MERKNVDAILKLVDAGFSKNEINALYGIGVTSAINNAENISTEENKKSLEAEEIPETTWKNVTSSLVGMIKDLQAANRALLNGQTYAQEPQNVDDIIGGFLKNGGFDDGRCN